MRADLITPMYQSTPSELISVLLAFKRIATFHKINPTDYRSTLLTSILASFPTIAEPLDNLLASINEYKVRIDLLPNLLLVTDRRICLSAGSRER
jgi:hypothetical protein